MNLKTVVEEFEENREPMTSSEYMSELDKVIGPLTHKVKFSKNSNNTPGETYNNISKYLRSSCKYFYKVIYSYQVVYFESEKEALLFQLKF